MDALARQRQLVTQYPQNELARFSLGKALFDRGEYAEAQIHLGEAIQRKPDWMVVEILWGKCAMNLGQQDAARAAFARALELAIAQHHEGPQLEMQQLLSELQ